MNLGSHSGLVFKDHFFFGAFSDGYKTRVNQLKPSNQEYQENYDSFVFKY
jgi:hypothetical protein